MDTVSFLTLAAAKASGKAEAASAAATAIQEYAESGVTLKGSVAYAKDLPSSGNEVGDEYIIKYTGESGMNYSGQKYIWDGKEWIPSGGSLRLYRDEDGDLCEED